MTLMVKYGQLFNPKVLLQPSMAEFELGMHNIGFFADIRYADISNSLWPIANAEIFFAAG